MNVVISRTYENRSLSKSPIFEVVISDIRRLAGFNELYDNPDIRLAPGLRPATKSRSSSRRHRHRIRYSRLQMFSHLT